MIEIRRNPSSRDLRIFGVLLAGFVVLVGGWFRLGGNRPDLALAVWWAGAALILLYLTVAPVRRPLFVAWMYAAYPIGWTVSHIVMGVVYYLVLTPIGLLLRFQGRSPIDRRLDPQRESDWEVHEPHREPKRYFRQF